MERSLDLGQNSHPMKSSKNPTIFEIPSHLAAALQELQAAVDNLADIAGHKQKRFTLDGRLIGDLGEVIASHISDLELTETQKTGFDATIASGPSANKHVEVKCRRKSTSMTFDRVPTHLIVLKILKGDHQVQIVYAGSGDVLREIKSKASMQSDRKLSTSITVSTTQLASKFDPNSLETCGIPLRPH